MDAATLASDGHGLVAIYVRPPGSPDLAQHLCSDGADWSLRCRTVAGDGIVAELERSRGKRWNLLLTTPTAPAAVPRGAFYFVSLTNPLEVLAASPRTFTANPQCTALLPPGEMASLKACTLLWHELSLRCNWVGDLRDARSHRELVTELVARGGGVWRHARPAMPPFELTPFEPEPLRFTSTAQELEPLRARHAGDYALYRWARKQHATCTRGGHYVRGDDDTPPYTQIGRYYSTVKRLALGCDSPRAVTVPGDEAGPRDAHSLPQALEHVVLIIQASLSSRCRTPRALDTGIETRRRTFRHPCGQAGRTTLGCPTTARRCTRRMTGARRCVGFASSSSATPPSTRRSCRCWGCCTPLSGRPLEKTSSWIGRSRGR